VFVALSLACVGFAVSPPAQQQVSKDLYVVTYIDVFPNYAADTAKLLQEFRTNSQKDPGFVRLEILRDVARQNHFSIVEVWKTQKDFDAHLMLAHTKLFREKIQPGLGSPFDDRMYNLLQ
jgi:quinol monooxygenase YgiN